MGRLSNILLMIVPASLLMLVLTIVMMVGGIAMIIGARRLGLQLVATAIATPLVIAGFDLLFEQAFALLPAGLVAPAAYLAIATCGIMLLYSLIHAVFGQAAVDHAKGQILYDLLRGSARLMFSRFGVAAALALFVTLWVNGGSPL